MSTEEHKAINRRVIEEAWNRGNLDVIDHLMHPDYTRKQNTTTVQGLQETKQLMTDYRQAFPDMHITIEEELVEGDKIATRYTGSGTHTGTFLGIAPTGKHVTVNAMGFHRIVDGKRVEDWLIFDGLSLLEQLGVISLPGQAVLTQRGDQTKGDPHLSAQDNATLIQTLMDAFNTKDVDRYAAISTDDCEVLDVPSGMTFKGPDGFRQFVQNWMTAFPDGQVQATSLFTTEDQGHVEYMARGTNTGPFPYASGPIPPTGRRVEFRVCAGLQFREGKVASIHYYYDLLSVLQQLGLVPTASGELVPIS